MSFYEYSYPGSTFLTDDWKIWAEGILRTCEELGLCFHQSHGYTYDFLDPDLSAQERAWQDTLVRRSIDCCAMLGAKVVVMHVSAGKKLSCTRRELWDYNRRYLRTVVDYAAQHGIRIAAENQFYWNTDPDKMFFCRAREIADFLDECADPRLGCCWDFEHGAIMELDQAEEMRILGSRLLATHVSDAVSKTFEPFMHVMPFTGTLDWMPIMHALQEIGYEGAFSFEAHNFLKKMPDPLVETGLLLSYQIGLYLLSL